MIRAPTGRNPIPSPSAAEVPASAKEVREARGSRYMVPDPAQSRTLSADLLAFLTPQEFHPLWGAWAREKGLRDA